MRLALINGVNAEAFKGAKGTCALCGSELIAKCGDVKIKHWSHKGNRNCDPWWENETEWHRSWKNNFATEWQERIFTDERTGEKHIADVRTVHGLVIEFQHSHIDPQERTKRENFYKKMIWVVDGVRLKRDYPRFFKGKQNFRQTEKQGIFLINFPEECFPSAWLGSAVPVIFDFRGTESISDPRDARYPLYYLFPKSNVRESLVALLSRESLINSIIKGELYKQLYESQMQIVKPPIKSSPNLPQRPSQYAFHRGQLIKRRRL